MTRLIRLKELIMYTEKEILDRLYKNEPTNKLIGLSDKFTNSEILAMLESEHYPNYSKHFRDWLWQTVTFILDGNE